MLAATSSRQTANISQVSIIARWRALAVEEMWIPDDKINTEHKHR